MTQFLKRLWPEKQGEALPEYALLLILIGLTALAGVKGVASTIDHFYSNTSSQVTSVASHPSITTDSVPVDNSINTNDPSPWKGAKPSPN